MKVYKVTLLIVDHDEVGDGIQDEIENVSYPNRCLSPQVMDIESVDIGEWRDSHPLNQPSMAGAEFVRLFPEASK